MMRPTMPPEYVIVSEHDVLAVVFLAVVLALCARDGLYLLGGWASLAGRKIRRILRHRRRTRTMYHTPRSRRAA